MIDKHALHNLKRIAKAMADLMYSCEKISVDARNSKRQLGLLKDELDGLYIDLIKK